MPHGEGSYLGTHLPAQRGWGRGGGKAGRVDNRLASKVKGAEPPPPHRLHGAATVGSRRVGGAYRRRPAPRPWHKGYLPGAEHRRRPAPRPYGARGTCRGRNGAGWVAGARGEFAKERRRGAAAPPPCGRAVVGWRLPSRPPPRGHACSAPPPPLPSPASSGPPAARRPGATSRSAPVWGAKGAGRGGAVPHPPQEVTGAPHLLVVWLPCPPPPRPTHRPCTFPPAAPAALSPALRHYQPQVHQPPHRGAHAREHPALVALLHDRAPPPGVTAMATVPVIKARVVIAVFLLLLLLLIVIFKRVGEVSHLESLPPHDAASAWRTRRSSSAASSTAAGGGGVSGT